MWIGIGRNGNKDDKSDMEGFENNSAYDFDSNEEELEGIQVVDEIFKGSSVIPMLKLLKEEDCIRKPWKRCLIIKLLDKKVGFRFLKRKLLQIWKGTGVFELVDLGCDYYLVKFSCMDDKSICSY